MPSLGDSVFIFMLALMLFGPKKLPQLARQLGKLMAEFRRASNDFRMQMEDELRLDEQKEHQKKVDALAPPLSTVPNPDIPTEDPPHPHMPATLEQTVPQPIAESGDLKLMPPSTGLPVESRGRNAYTSPAPVPDAAPAIPEHSIASDQFQQHAGISSDEPSEDAISRQSFTSAPVMYESAAEDPAPDRRQPVMVGEGERATHA